MSKKMSMTRNIIDYLVRGLFYIIFSPILLLDIISNIISNVTQFILNKWLQPLCNKCCIIARGPIPNSTVQVKGSEDGYFKRINENLLTIKEAKKLASEYENKGYEVNMHLSEF
jgi:hypothetical protein